MPDHEVSGVRHVLRVVPGPEELAAVRILRQIFWSDDPQIGALLVRVGRGILAGAYHHVLSGVGERIVEDDDAALLRTVLRAQQQKGRGGLVGFLLGVPRSDGLGGRRGLGGQDVLGGRLLLDSRGVAFDLVLPDLLVLLAVLRGLLVFLLLAI